VDKRTDHCILQRSPNVGFCARPAQSETCTEVGLKMKTSLYHLSNVGWKRESGNALRKRVQGCVRKSGKGRLG
jgi:hypothetical protein